MFLKFSFGKTFINGICKCVTYFCEGNFFFKLLLKWAFRVLELQLSLRRNCHIGINIVQKNDGVELKICGL